MVVGVLLVLVVLLVVLVRALVLRLVVAGTLLVHVGLRIAETEPLADLVAGLRLPPGVVLLVRGLRCLLVVGG